MNKIKYFINKKTNLKKKIILFNSSKLLLMLCLNKMKIPLLKKNRI